MCENEKFQSSETQPEFLEKIISASPPKSSQKIL
jgi:hypothetical protein